MDSAETMRSPVQRSNPDAHQASPGVAMGTSGRVNGSKSVGTGRYVRDRGEGREIGSDYRREDRGVEGVDKV